MSSKNKKMFKVVSIHPTNVCNLNCSFCYKGKGDIEPDEKFWCKMPKYLKEITNQVAMGGGEIFLFPEFIKKFSKRCIDNDLICNITSNGRPLMKMSDKLLKKILSNIKMVSISFDKEKIKTSEDLTNYMNLVNRIKKLTKCEVGCNLLVDSNMFEKEGLVLYRLVNYLFKIVGVDRIFALSLKNYPCPDILKHKDIYKALSMKYRNFFVDDLSRMIIDNNSYEDWKVPCHRGLDMISIQENGGISTCSFAKSFTYLKEPKDLLSIEIPKEEMGVSSCPFLVKGN